MDLEAARTRLFSHFSWEIRDKRVIDAMQQVPREEFVPFAQRSAAYDDRPLSIGYGQTISQPFIVALMVQALDLKTTDKVLEVGAGSGYVSAVLGQLASSVVGVEIIPELAEAASLTLQRLNYRNVSIHVAPRSSLGWLPEAPYDAIIVSAGAPSVPAMLLGQLKWNGRMVIPVGSRFQQNLLRIVRKPEGDEVEDMGGCFFVPLLGEGAWNS